MMSESEQKSVRDSPKISKKAKKPNRQAQRPPLSPPKHGARSPRIPPNNRGDDPAPAPSPVDANQPLPENPPLRILGIIDDRNDYKKPGQLKFFAILRTAQGRFYYLDSKPVGENFSLNHTVTFTPTEELVQTKFGTMTLAKGASLIWSPPTCDRSLIPAILGKLVQEEDAHHFSV